MKNAEIIAETEKIISGFIAETGCSVYDVEFLKEGPNHYLRVFIDKEGGVGLTDCELVSRRLEKILDERDFIERSYILEVSSPGADRKLKKETDFIKYAGADVDIKFYKPRGEKKEYRGELKCLKDGNVTIIAEDGSELTAPLAEIASARLSVL